VSLISGYGTEISVKIFQYLILGNKPMARSTKPSTLKKGTLLFFHLGIR